MSKTTLTLQQELLKIIHEEYEDCSFFMAASNILTRNIADLAENIENNDLDFDTLRDKTCEIGLLISNTEKRLEEVEECYTKLVDVLARHKPEKS